MLTGGAKPFALDVAEKTNWLQRLVGGKPSPVEVEHQTAVGNIYHCCVHKTASQWIARMLADEQTYRFCGLKTHHYQRELPDKADARPIRNRTFTTPFPARTIVTPIYIGRENFLAIPKPPAHRAFFVMRDPRDILVSWYFSWKNSHPVMGNVSERREQLKKLGEDDGLIFGIERLAEDGLFDALRSWRTAGVSCPEIMVVRYEDLIDADQFACFQRIFTHCDIRTPADILRDILTRHSFSALTRGRERGAEDVTSHLRKGIHGDWKNHFSTEVTARFRATTGDLVEALGYTW